MEPPARLHPHVVGARLRRHRSGARPRHAPADSWLPKTALVCCDVYRKRASRSGGAPLGAEASDRRGRWPRATSSRTAAELELVLLRETFEEARAERYQEPNAVLDVPRGLSHLADDEGMSRSSAPSATAWKRPTCRWETSKGEWGRGQEEINLVYAEALADGRPRTCSTSTAPRRSRTCSGCSLTFMAKLRHGRGRLVVPPARVAAGTERTQAALRPRQASPPGHAAVRSLARRADGDGARPGVSSTRAGVNSYKRYQSGSFSAHAWPRGWDDSRNLRLRAVRRGPVVPRREPDPRRRPPTRTWPSRRPSRPACTASAASLRRPSSLQGSAYEDATLPPGPQDTCGEAIARLERSKVARARLAR